jgi:hypothetical protein
MDRLVCHECQRISDLQARGWRAYRGDVRGEDATPTVVVYCPSCAEREFGPPVQLRDTRIPRTDSPS